LTRNNPLILLDPLGLFSDVPDYALAGDTSLGQPAWVKNAYNYSLAAAFSLFGVEAIAGAAGIGRRQKALPQQLGRLPLGRPQKGQEVFSPAHWRGDPQWNSLEYVRPTWCCRRFRDDARSD